MKINIFKNKEFWTNLEARNQPIRDVSNQYYKYNLEDKEYDLEHNVISRWFNPDHIKNCPTSRTYPNLAQEQLDAKYNLVLYNANYLPLFLIPTLGFDRETSIEDLGAGVGHLLVYLNALGYSNFHVVENFSQMTKFTLDVMMNKFNIQYSLNKEWFPQIVNNSGIPDFYIYNFRRLAFTDLFICYTNRTIEKWAEQELTKRGFVYLCRDSDDFSFAYCKYEKHKEYSEKLKEFVV